MPAGIFRRECSGSVDVDMGQELSSHMHGGGWREAEARPRGLFCGTVHTDVRVPYAVAVVDRYPLRVDSLLSAHLQLRSSGFVTRRVAGVTFVIFMVIFIRDAGAYHTGRGAHTNIHLLPPCSKRL